MNKIFALCVTLFAWYPMTQASELIAPIDLNEVPVADTALLESIKVPIEMVNQSWFTDRIGTAMIHFAEMVEVPKVLPPNVPGVRWIDVEVRDTSHSESSKATAIVRFLLSETGVVTFPSLEFFSQTKQYQSEPVQLSVSTAVNSDSMKLTLKPTKLKVYEGEPLQIDMTWQCDLDASRLQALNYSPSFFSDPDVKIVIPRSTETEQQQVGLPVGGRRVIAKRTLNEGDKNALGTVELPLFLQFMQPGIYTLPETRLECAYLAKGSHRQFGQYAAHFNNSLFAPEEDILRYERLFVSTPAVEIEVLPLPEEGRMQSFSGLFEPVRLAVAVTPNQLKVGNLITAELEVSCAAPHGMIDLPVLSQQQALRGHFLVDDDLVRLWRADGTTFRCRLRALSTNIEAFPALRIQTFDTKLGAYIMRMTEPVELRVEANDGEEYIDLRMYKGISVTLSKQSDGIWHNLKANRMNDLMNSFVICLASWFWLWLLFGVVIFLLFLPVIRESRRCSMDLQYRARTQAYTAFRKLPENAPEKWSAFLHFLAVSFGSKGSSWTVGDSKAALRQVNLDEDEINSVLNLHGEVDAEVYSAAREPAQMKALNGVAKRILYLVGKTSMVLLLIAVSLPQQVWASSWTDAEALFEQALGEEVGSEKARALYVESALNFEAVAESGERPGLAWYNAANSWFKIGALGRSIAAYRYASIYRPFDSDLADNLAAARALTLTDVPVNSAWYSRWPTAWVKALLLVFLWILGGMLLLYLRYRGRWYGVGVCCLFVLCGVLCGFWGTSVIFAERFGVVIVDSAIARKGPSYAYASAFHEPLRDGVEFSVKEIRGGWALVELTDGRTCWLLISQVQLT
ncbi:MAG: hypothetical protein P8I96_08495 [Opitutae bacterium]|nr:hypothetical protein [Opitutae bacterium]